jgi:hypothetical protein
LKEALRCTPTKYDEAAERHKLVTLGDSTYAQADPAFGQVLPS